MAKDERLFAPFDIGMDEHPKIVGLTDAAFRAFYEGIFYSRRLMSDGFLDKRIVLRRWGQVVADELSANDPERPSWLPVENGWQIRDFEKHHPLRAEIEQKRTAVSEAKSAAGKRSGEVRRAKAEQEANTNEQNANITGTKSNPETETETETPSPEGKGKQRRLPADWVPNAAHYERAKSTGVNVAAEAERFKLHADTHDRHAVNWNAAFTSWLIKAKPSQRAGGTDWALKL